MERRASLSNRRRGDFEAGQARLHTERITLEKIKELEWKLLLHSTYSPDLAPSDNHLIRSMEPFSEGYIILLLLLIRLTLPPDRGVLYDD